MMKPLKLTMKSFGPYRQEKIIDFTLFSSNLFLISGATGSGKTTILDGMCIALYGKSTGGLRSFRDMRNLSAQNDDITCVEFIFEVDKTRYKFKRSLKQHKVKGNFELKDEHEAYVWDNDEYIYRAGKSERRVTEFAQSIIGLTCEQFSKVVVLPQGEFKNLLVSNSREKAKIFESLFDTQKWSNLCEKMKDIAILDKSKCDELSIAIKVTLDREAVTDVDLLLEKISKMKTELQNTDDEVKNAERDYHTALIACRAVDDQMLKNVHNIGAVEECECDDIESTLRVAERYPVLLSKYNTLKSIDESYRKLESQKKMVETLNKECMELEKALNVQLKTLEGLNLEFTKLNSNTRDSVIMSLMNNLIEGKACPVCGSTHHPAIMSDYNVDNHSKKIEVLQKEIVSTEKVCNNYRDEFSEKKCALEVARASLRQQQAICDGFNVYYKAFGNELDRAFAELDKSKQACLTLLGAKKQIQNNFNVQEKRYKYVLSRIGMLREQIGKSEESLEKLRKLEHDFEFATSAYSRSHKLSNLLSGNNPMKMPIKFFVLSMMFDVVLSRANVYFASLSNYRYSLSRAGTKSNSRGYAGLDVEVFDNEYGEVRPVETLSGGELFLASLSLAFGLSDAVQSYSGGIHIDSIFIDEGFGYLDSDTLSTAVKAFFEIQKIGRTIGIISHVSELKDYITTCITI